MPSNWLARPYPLSSDAFCRGVHFHKDTVASGSVKPLNKAVHMNCFDVFIIGLVTVIFLVVHIHHDHLVTTFELSHILTNTLNDVFLLLI